MFCGKVLSEVWFFEWGLGKILKALGDLGRKLWVWFEEFLSDFLCFWGIFLNEGLCFVGKALKNLKFFLSEVRVL